jgi:hypothetical protein
MTPAVIITIIPPVMSMAITAPTLMLTSARLSQDVRDAVAPIEVPTTLAVRRSTRASIAPDEGEVFNGRHVR